MEPIARDYVSWSCDGRRRGLAAFSSRGPTSDNRIKPEVVAPATDVVSCRTQVRGSTFGWGVYDKDYVFAGGTSMATPLAAGAAALVREWLARSTVYTNPSAALVKAVLIGGAESLAPGQYGYGVRREIPGWTPNNAEGWGLVNVLNSLAPSNASVICIADGARVETGETN